MLNKNVWDTSCRQVVSELDRKRNLSVVLASIDTLLGYRCNWHQLTKALNMNGSLETVILRYCLISDDFANVLLSTKFHKLLRLLIGYSTLKSDQIANVIKKNPDVKELYLSYNDLKQSATAILKALKGNSQLKILDLSYNNMTRAIAEDLANAIKCNLGLEELYLEGNNLGPSAIMILQALKEKTILTKLNLRNNNMTGAVVQDLANVINNNSNLDDLLLCNNDFKQSAVVILQALKSKCKLKTLSLSGNNMTGEVARDLANVIKNNIGIKNFI